MGAARESVTAIIVRMLTREKKYIMTQYFKELASWKDMTADVEVQVRLGSLRF